MTKADLRERIEESEKANRALREELLRDGPLARAGLELARLWLRDCPLNHRGGCACHFCLTAHAVVRMEAEQENEL